MSVRYEWDIETVDRESDDIIDHDHADTLNDFSPVRFQCESHEFTRLVLVRDGGEPFRQWAYIEDGKLPDRFRDANEVERAKVPDKFHRELQRWLKDERNALALKGVQ